MEVNGSWVSRASYTNQDQPQFRTIGEKVGTDVKDSQISCLAADFKTVRTGQANCWPFWIEGGTIEFGLKTDGKPIKQDKFVWLTNEGVTCGKDTNGADITGYDKCKIDKQIPCNTSKLGRLNVSANSEDICIPTITWKKR